METGHTDNIRECIEGRAESLLEAQQEATRSIPLYQQSGEYAKEHGELDAFWASLEPKLPAGMLLRRQLMRALME